MTPRLPPGCVIALLGACATERDALAQALADRLNQRGIAATLVADPLAPTPLQQRIAQAAAQGVVIAADTPLGRFASAHDTPDDAAVAGALAAHRRWAMTLLVGIDAPPAGAAYGELAARDARLRAWLLGAGVAFSVVHGQGPQRLANAWNAILAGQDEPDSTGGAGAATRAGAAPRAWAQACDRCSDPACEHRLFTGLLASRGNSAR